MAAIVVALALVLAGALVLVALLRRRSARGRTQARSTDADELTALLRQDFRGEQSELERCAELHRERAAAAELEARLRETKIRIAVLEERQVGRPQRL